MNFRINPPPPILAVLILSLAALQAGATPPDAESTRLAKKHPSFGRGPSIILLHDSSLADQDWALAAQELASAFEVTLLDISEIVSDSRAAQKLRQMIDQLGIEEVRIAGSARGEPLARRYALTFPHRTRSFTLPDNCEDLKLLAQLFTSTPLTKS